MKIKENSLLERKKKYNLIFLSLGNIKSIQTHPLVSRMKIVGNIGKKYELNRANKKFEIFNSYSMLTTFSVFYLLPTSPILPTTETSRVLEF